MSITKLGKKLGCLLMAIFMMFAIISCTEPQEDPAKATAQQHNDEIYEKIYWDASAMIDITVSKLTLATKTKYEDTVVTWSSSDPSVISETGAVTRPAYTHENATLVNPSDPEDTSKHVEVKLTASIKTTYGTDGKAIVNTKEFKFTVLCLDENLDFGTIADVKAHAYQYIYEEQGVQKDLVSNSSVTYSVGFYGKVTAILNASGAGQFMVHDGTEGIYVYSTIKDLKIGDTVLVYGNIYSYYGSLQVGSNITASIVEDRGITLPAHTEISVEDWEHNYEIGYLGGKLYSIYAKLETGSNTPANDTYKLVDPFTGEVAWIYYKSYNAEQEEVLKTYVGKYVNITGVTYDRDSRCVKNHLLWDGGIEEAQAPTLTDEQKLANVKAVVEELAGEYTAGSALELPVENKEYGATISWTIPENAPYKDGKFDIVTEKVTFVAKATIKVNEATLEVNVEMVVKPVEEVTVAAACGKEVGTVVKLSGTVETIFGSKGYFYLKDATGTILVYVNTASGITVNGVTVTIKAGDKLTLTGSTAVYNGTPQIGSIVSYDAHEAGEWQISAPKQTSFEELKALTIDNNLYGQYLMLRGKIVSDGEYFLFSNGEVSISLYNSNVPEALQAIKDTETEATLFFYYYGNSKKDYTGTIRVVFSGRSGEYFIGDEPVVIPEGRGEIVTEFAVKSFDELEALVPEAGNTTTEKYYVAGYIKEVTNAKYGNMTIETADGSKTFIVYGTYNVDGTLRYDAMTDAPKVGQAVVLYGIMTNYNGTKEMKNAWIVQIDDKVCEVSSGPTDREEIVTEFAVKTFDELEALVPEAGNTTTEKYYVAGYIKAVTNDTYGNMTIETADGSKTFIVYGTYNLDGTLRYDAMTDAPKVGQAVVLYGIMTNYNGTKEMKNAWIVQIDDKVCEAPKHEHVACPECGKCIAKDCDGTEEEKCAGHGTATMPQELSFTDAANKASGDDYMKVNFPTWTINGKLGQTYGGYLGFGRSGDKVSSITSDNFAATKEFTVTAVIKGNGSNGAMTSTLSFELLDKDGNVVATGYANGSTTELITPVDAKDTEYVIEFTFAEGKTIADAQNLRISFSKNAGNIGLKSVVYNEKQ